MVLQPLLLLQASAASAATAAIDASLGRGYFPPIWGCYGGAFRIPRLDIEDFSALLPVAPLLLVMSSRVWAVVAANRVWVAAPLAAILGSRLRVPVYLMVKHLGESFMRSLPRTRKGFYVILL